MGKAWAVVAVAAAGIALWALVEAREARHIVAERSPEAPGRAEALEARIERLEKRVAAKEDPAVERGETPSPTSSPAPGIPGATPDALRIALDGPAPEAALRALVRQEVRAELDERTKEAAAGEKEPPRAEGRKPPLSQVAAELDLDEAQREAVHQAVLHGQEETIGLLRTPTAGGRVPLDDLLKVLLEKPDSAKERMIEVFGMLATEKVPGSEETYAQRVEGVKRATADTFRRSFSPEQFRAYEKTGQDPLEIQVPDSPWIQVLQEAWKAKR